MRQFLLSDPHLLLGCLELIVNFRDRRFSLDEQALQFLFVTNQLFNLRFARLQSFSDLGKVHIVNNHGLADLAHATELINREAHHGHIVHVVKNRCVE